MFESCGMFSLQEFGLLICYQQLIHINFRTHQLSQDKILQSYIALFAFFCFLYFCVFRTRPLFESWTRARLGRHRPDCTRPDRHILHSKCYEVNKRCEEKKLFALTTVSSPLPDCDAYNPPYQYISIHVRLFLSLAI